MNKGNEYKCTAAVTTGPSIVMSPFYPSFTVIRTDFIIQYEEKVRVSRNRSQIMPQRKNTGEEI